MELHQITMQRHNMPMPLSGNVDKDFAAMMILHHRQAPRMSDVHIRHGKNERLKALARNTKAAAAGNQSSRLGTRREPLDYIDAIALQLSAQRRQASAHRRIASSLPAMRPQCSAHMRQISAQARQLAVCAGVPRNIAFALVVQISAQVCKSAICSALACSPPMLRQWLMVSTQIAAQLKQLVMHWFIPVLRCSAV